MSILAEMSNREESGFTLLVFKDPDKGSIKPVGIRLKFYSLDKCDFDYYDFALEHVKNKYHKSFLNRLSKKLPQSILIRHGDLLMTQDEIDGSVVVSEVKSEDVVASAIDTAITIYKENEFFALDSDKDKYLIPAE